MLSKERLLEMLERERDRLAMEADGIGAALDAGCSTAALGAILPGLFPLAALAATAVCALGSVTDAESRLQRIEALIGHLESLAVAVDDADESDVERWAQLERAVQQVTAATRDVSVRSEIFDEVAQAAEDVASDFVSLYKTGIVVAVVVAVVAAVVTFSRKRRG